MKSPLPALIAVLTPLCASQAHAKQVETKDRTVFCRSIADADQFARYVASGDYVAANAFYEAKRAQISANGDAACWKDPPSFYTVSDTQPGTIAPMECLRMSGFLTCAWTIGVSHMPYNR